MSDRDDQRERQRRDRDRAGRSPGRDRLQYSSWTREAEFGPGNWTGYGQEGGWEYGTGWGPGDSKGIYGRGRPGEGMDDRERYRRWEYDPSGYPGRYRHPEAPRWYTEQRERHSAWGEYEWGGGGGPGMHRPPSGQAPPDQGGPDTPYGQQGTGQSTGHSDDFQWDKPGASGQGPHAGRGPRNYKRSDERIREEVNDHLTENHEVDASDIEVDVSGAEVLLRGEVASRHMKRVAEDVAWSVSGVQDVRNELKVNPGQRQQE